MYCCHCHRTWQVPLPSYSVMWGRKGLGWVEATIHHWLSGHFRPLATNEIVKQATPNSAFGGNKHVPLQLFDFISSSGGCSQVVVRRPEALPADLWPSTAVSMHGLKTKFQICRSQQVSLACCQFSSPYHHVFVFVFQVWGSIKWLLVVSPRSFSSKQSRVCPCHRETRKRGNPARLQLQSGHWSTITTAPLPTPAGELGIAPASPGKPCQRHQDEIITGSWTLSPRVWNQGTRVIICPFIFA